MLHILYIFPIKINDTNKKEYEEKTHIGNNIPATQTDINYNLMDGSKSNVTLRITVFDKCNFACNYCPVGMEVYEPIKEKQHEAKRGVNENLKEKSSMNISNDEIIDICKSAVETGIDRVSLTGGEPLLRKDLATLCKRIKTETGIKRLEITTNGVLLPKFLSQAGSEYTDLIKISFDSVNESKFNSIVKSNSYQKVIDGINFAKTTDINLVLNVVLTKENFDELNAIIRFGEEHEIDISLLDLVYNTDTREFRQNNFLDFGKVIEYLDKQYPRITEQAFSDGVKKRLEADYFGMRNTDAKDYSEHGINYIFYDTGRIYIRIKDSKSATRRDNHCNDCEEYCQEGIHSIRLSPKGWVTACQSNEANKGFSTKQLNIEETADGLNKILKRFKDSYKDPSSFQKMKEIHDILANND